MKQLFQIGSFLSFILFISLPFSGTAQTIQKGLWYHQQPTSVSDKGSFYGGKDGFEGFCGLAASEMLLQYYIPNIHYILYQKYGPVDFHDDARGGLKSSDPDVYNSAYTYNFQDFLGHRYINRHITKTGCSYREIEKMFRAVSSEIPGYKMDFEWIKKAQIPEYLDKGYLMILNTNQGGGHYVLVGGWQPDSLKPACNNYYIWDGWKFPLDLDSSSFTYTSEIAGNISNMGSAKLANIYKVNSEGFNKIFKDQRGDSTLPAIRFMPAVSASSVANLKNKGIILRPESLNGKAASVMDVLSAHSITDLFVNAETSGGVLLTGIEELTEAAHKQNIKVHVIINIPAGVCKASVKNITPVEGSIKNPGSFASEFISQVIEPLCKNGVDGLCFTNLYSSCSKKNIKQFINSVKNCSELYCKDKLKIGAVTEPSVFTKEVKSAIKERFTSYTPDYILPILFTHDNNENPSWVGTSTFVINKALSGSCLIWPAIKTIDNDNNFMTSLEMKQCLQNAAANGASGIVLSHYPVADWQWDILDSTR
jgi:hypothetical protein